MKIRTALFALVVLLTLTSCGKKEEGPKVLLYIRGGSGSEFMLREEVGVMKDLLEQSGFDVVVATVSGKPIEEGSISLKPVLKLRDVNVADYVGFILPSIGGDVSRGSASHAKEAIAMVKEAVAQGKPVAAQVNSVLTLAYAGVLEGKKFAFPEESDFNFRTFPIFEGGIFIGTGVVQDGNIITSGICPSFARKDTIRAPWKETQHGTEELTRALIAAMQAETD